MDLPELAKLAEIYHCELWMLLAAPPDTTKLDHIKRAKGLIDTMSKRQADSWLNLGDEITSPEK